MAVALAGVAAWQCFAPYDFYGPPQTVKRTQATISFLGVALDLHRVNVGRYPRDSDGGLDALVTRPIGDESERWAGPYVKDQSDLTDAWGRKLIYVCPGKHNPSSYDLSSAGADRIENTDDDITNWKQ